MRTPKLLLLLPLAVACNRPPEYVGPAPAGAISCALDEALDLGYRRMEGSADERFVRVSQRPDPAPGEGAVSVDPPPGTGRRPGEAERPAENQLIFREEGGRLRIQVVSFADGQPTTTPMPTADAHARRILATCTG
ncbi:MAG TPA: hypothetical protein VFZ18_09080 [Longimicrobiaceae bacterium]